MGKIVALGGGGWAKSQTGKIVAEIIALTGKRRPRVLYVPTPSLENPITIRKFQRIYERTYGCRTDVLYLLGTAPPPGEIRRKIEWADIVFVGGGNTLLMMRRWRFLGVDRELRKAYQRGTVLAGGSAGSICWFEQGHSDSMHGYGHKPWEYIAVAGMGLLGGIHCPHYHHKDRRTKFRSMIRQRGLWGLAIDDRAALEVVDGQWRVIANCPGAKAYVVTRHRGRVRERPIEPGSEFRPLAELYALK